MSAEAIIQNPLTTGYQPEVAYAYDALPDASRWDRLADGARQTLRRGGAMALATATTAAMALLPGAEAASADGVTSHETSYSCKPNGNLFDISMHSIMPVGPFWAKQYYDWSLIGRDIRSATGHGHFDSQGVAHPAVNSLGREVGSANLTLQGFDKSHNYSTLAKLKLVFNCGAVPVLTDVSPGHGSMQGGNWVDIHGKRLKQVKQVKFGDIGTKDIRHISRSELKARAPKGSDVGTIAVRLRNGLRLSAKTHNDQYDYRRT